MLQTSSITETLNLVCIYLKIIIDQKCDSHSGFMLYASDVTESSPLIALTYLLTYLLTNALRYTVYTGAGVGFSGREATAVVRQGD